MYVITRKSEAALNWKAWLPMPIRQILELPKPARQTLVAQPTDRPDASTDERYYKLDLEIQRASTIFVCSICLSNFMQMAPLV